MSRYRDSYHKVLSPMEKLAGRSNWYDIGREVRAIHCYTCTHPGCNKHLGKTGGHVHHIIPLSRGGTTTKANLTLLCDEHHELRHPHMSRKRP